MLNVTVGSKSNYENGVSSPKEPILFKIIEERESKRVRELNDVKSHIIKLKKDNLGHSNTLEFLPTSSSQKTRTLNYYQRLASAGTGQLVFDDVPVDLIEIPDIPEYKNNFF